MSSKTTHRCKYCRLMVRWYVRFEKWGRPGGDPKYRFRCSMRPEGVEHEPTLEGTP